MSNESKSIIDRVELGLDVFLVVLLAVMVLSVNIQVFTRYCLGYGTAWSEILSRYLFVWISLFGSASALRKLAHFRVDFLLNKLKPSSARKLFFITSFIVGLFLFIMIYSGFRQVLSTWNMKEMGLKIRVAYLYLPIPVSGVLMVVFLIDTGWKRINRSTSV